jgi:hypothetical protein
VHITGFLYPWYLIVQVANNILVVNFLFQCPLHSLCYTHYVVLQSYARIGQLLLILLS